MLGSVHRRRAAARAWPATAMNATTCPTNRDVGSSQMSMCLVLVATPEIGSSERARLVKPALAVGEARRHDEHRDRPHHPDANRSDVFVLCPYNARAEPRAAATGYHGRWVRRLQRAVIRTLERALTQPKRARRLWRLGLPPERRDGDRMPAARMSTPAPPTETSATVEPRLCLERVRGQSLNCPGRRAAPLFEKGPLPRGPPPT